MKFILCILYRIFVRQIEIEQIARTHTCLSLMHSIVSAIIIVVVEVDVEWRHTDQMDVVLYVLFDWTVKEKSCIQH